MADPNTTSNSFSTILANFIRLQNNALTTLTQIQQATVSNADTLSITVTAVDGTTSSYTIPSFGFLKSSIARIDATLQKLMGFDGSDAYIRMPDGSFKRIYQSAYIRNPKPVGSLVTPSKFITEDNWFFESMYTPALKVNFDITPYVPQQESKIFVKRLLLKLDTPEKLAYFDGSLKGRNDVDYVQLMIDLQARAIIYFVDQEVVDLPLSIVRYTGDFVVVNMENREVTNPDGSTVIKRWYLFNTLNYSDNISTTKNTEVLKVGDRLIKGESMYEITEIDGTTNYMRVNRMNGYDPFVVGEPVSFYSETFSPKIVNVGIGFDEYDVIFFRTVNDEENIISTTWSPGIAFYTNDLNTDTTQGVVTMSDFYKTNVMDFGRILLSSAKEGKIAAVDGISPDAPTLDSANFKVVQINDHKLDQAEVESIRKKQADKVTLDSEITQLEKSIDLKKEELNSKKFNSETERRAVKTQLENLVREKSSKSSLYASIVKELTVIANQKPAALDTPKFRIRGFFGIPNPKQSTKTRPQEVIQFYTYYRYVRPDGSQSNVQQFDFVDQNGQIKKGTYSNLNEIKSEIRKKVYDISTGTYVWAAEDIENADSVNINQVDIPISKGEKVEFYIVSVSEAGWPENPMLSEGSNFITVEFPNDLASEDEASIALNEAVSESTRIQLESDLAAQGLDVHLSSSFNAAEKYYAHDADVISSNFYTPEGNVISLYNKIKELQDRIASMEDRLNKIAGTLSVYIVDPDANTRVSVKNGDVVQLFAGYYRDYVSLLPAADQRGAIVSKVYNISLQNAEATPLQLVSRFPGGIGGPLPTTLTALSQPPIPTFPLNSPYDASTLFQSVPVDTDYNSYRLYDRAPIVQAGITNTDTNNANKYASAFYQSGQTTGQFVYSRFKDIGLVNNLYGESPVKPYNPVDRVLVPVPAPTVTTDTFVWNGSFDTTPIPPAPYIPFGGGPTTPFCVHIDHPALQGIVAPIPAPTLITYQRPAITIDSTTGLPQAPEAVSEFRHSAFFNTAVTSKGGWSPQLSYYQRFLANAGPAPFATSYTPVTVEELPDKFGFVTDDRYLIGSNTCGSYFFLAPSTFNQLNVNGTDARATFIVNQGDTNAILIPVIFQFRMEDYYGPSGGLGQGIIGGYVPGGTPPKNLTYSRRIGLDIYAQDETVFSFDLQVSSTYKKTSLSQVLAAAVPTVNKEQQNIVYNKNTIKTLNS
jgi:hypothetical protein